MKMLLFSSDVFGVLFISSNIDIKNKFDKQKNLDWLIDCNICRQIFSDQITLSYSVLKNTISLFVLK